MVLAQGRVEGIQGREAGQFPFCAYKCKKKECDRGSKYQGYRYMGDETARLAPEVSAAWKVTGGTSCV